MIRVYADMVADLFHVGHVAFLEKARAEGDYLLVGIHSDQDAARYKRMPIMTMAERMGVVRACRYVDEVIGEAPLVISREFMVAHAIDLVVHAHPRSEQQAFAAFYEVPAGMGRFKRLDYSPLVCTRDIIRRISAPGDA